LETHVILLAKHGQVRYTRSGGVFLVARLRWRGAALMDVTGKTKKEPGVCSRNSRPDPKAFGSSAAHLVRQVNPGALRPYLAVGLPFRGYVHLYLRAVAVSVTNWCWRDRAGVVRQWVAALARVKDRKSKPGGMPGSCGHTRSPVMHHLSIVRPHLFLQSRSALWRIGPAPNRTPVHLRSCNIDSAKQFGSDKKVVIPAGDSREHRAPTLSATILD
jgi:hypothetical protein